jgi:DNA-directed RNA polymerase, mitochondrial
MQTTISTTAVTPADDLIAQQVQLETEMTTQGIARFRSYIADAQLHGREDATVYGMALMDGLIGKVTAGLEAFIAEREAGKAGRKGPTYRYIKEFDGKYEVISFIALRLTMASLMGKPTTAPLVAGRIGRAIEDEFRYRAVREKDAKFYDRLKDEADKRSAPHVKRTVVNLFIGRRDMDLPESWPEADVVLLGLHVLEIIIETTGLVYKLKVETGAKDSKTMLCPTEETKAFITSKMAAAEVMRPLYEPMIIPPVDWTSPMNGGYLTRRVRPLRLVKSFSKEYLTSLESQDISEVMDAVNVAQNTAWAINPFILTVLDIAWEKSYSLGGIPPMFDTPIPPQPFDIATNETARKAWRTEAALVHTENRELASKRATFASCLGIGHRYSLFPAIYFPYQLDFRGRIYAAPLLNPQGPDWMKAMLQFSEGKPLDEESAPFLAIQVANTGAFNKIDKAPLEDRVQWVYDNQEQIIECADNPFDNRWWTEADSPYCFLAACREWAGWVRQGVGFISHLPVALDGSCSGIQHFSMALADEVGGAAVNLVPSEKPADIYTLVLNKVVEKVNEDAKGGDDAEMAGAWLRSGLLARSLVKRPTMTYGYGSNQFGFREQVMADTLRPAYKAYQRGEGAWHFEDNGFSASLYMSRLIINAVEQTVLKAAEAMAWLKKVAGVVTEKQAIGDDLVGGLPVRWTTPDGFLVVQNYKEQNVHRIDTIIFGSRIRANVSSDSAMVDRRKQASGFSPNFVHSLDATHLRLTVRAAAAEGITAFALVHDSFGTHAADTGRFFAILRETMVGMYRGRDVMQNLYEEIKGQLPSENKHKLPEPPALGSLDIEAVVESDFAFA